MDPKFEQQRERSSRAFYLHKREGFLSACCNCHHHQKLFWPFSLAAAALLSPFSMHEINSLFYTLSLLCIAASEKTSPFPQKKTRHFSFQNFLCFIQWVWFSLDFIRREKIRPICISFFRRLLDKTRRVFCAYVLEKLIYTRVISSS